MVRPPASSPEQDVIRRAYAAFNRRDLDEALSLMAEDVEWPNGMEGGIERGRAAVRAYWSRQWSMIDPHVDPVAMREVGPGRWVVDVHQLVRALDGTILHDRMVRHIYELRAGLITRMTIEA